MLTNQRFTIGEMARMHRIPESTLRYYDEKGIFHPAIVDPQTQYRYYTIDQFSMLDTIKFLRNLDIPLKQIKQYMEERTPTNALELLERQKELMAQKQKELSYMIMKMDNNIRVINQALQGKKDVVVFKQIPKRMITSAAIDPGITDEMFDYYINTLQNNLHLHDVSLFVGTIGVTITREALLRRDFQACNSVFILIHTDTTTNKVQAETAEVIEEGLFASANHYGPYEHTKETYELLLEEMKRHGYEVAGDSIELGLIDYSMTSNAEDYITEIQIPVIKR